MAHITLTTKIKAPQNRVFDLARSVDLYLAGNEDNGKECTVAGRSSGLREAGESVTWKVGHLGNRQTMTTDITEMEEPKLFREVMTQGEFRSFEHLRSFEVDAAGEVTTMLDEISYTLGFGILGKAVANLLLTAYLRESVRRHNNSLKAIAESDDWQKYLPDAPQKD